MRPLITYMLCWLAALGGIGMIPTSAAWADTPQASCCMEIKHPGMPVGPCQCPKKDTCSFRPKPVQAAVMAFSPPELPAPMPASLGPARQAMNANPSHTRIMLPAAQAHSPPPLYLTHSSLLI